MDPTYKNGVEQFKLGPNLGQLQSTPNKELVFGSEELLNKKY